ncbi:MAG: hydantoinase/oxoprolinase family protein [Hyphomicrobiales bacterium]
MIRIGVDIGGTFTDFAVWRSETDSYVEIGSHKLPTSRPDFAEAVIEGIADIAKQCKIAADDPVIIVHGTTISTNAVIERSQPPIALITTQGYRDLLGIARLRLDKPVDLFNRRATPITPRELVFEVGERILADGSVDTELDEASVVEALGAARQAGAAAVAICFLNSYRNPAHEQRALAIARQGFPELAVVASHEVWPQQSEYERAVLTLLNVYVKQLMDAYLGRIDAFLADRLPGARLFVMKSNGGMMSAAEARALPVHTLLSGPAAGVTGARMLGEFLKLERILTFDMGGTSTDVSLIEGGRAMITAQAEVGEFPILMPATAVEAMGAGGGSIVWLDGGVMKVGPRSAGSRPGPACYGQGGEAPTLTDAYLICNLLSPKGLLGGRLALDRSLAERAFAPIAEALGSDVTGAAESAIAVATSNMLAKVLPYLARVGVEPSDCTLMIFGGAGGLHGPMLADELGIRRIVAPRAPSVFCAFGCLVSDLVHDAVKSVHGIELCDETLALGLEEIAAQGDAWLARQADPRQLAGIDRVFTADMRYAAQSFSIAVELAQSGEGSGMEAARRRFHEEHERLFGHANAASAVAIDNLRLRSFGRQAKPTLRQLPAAEAPAPSERRELRLNGGWAGDCPVFAQGLLAPGFAVAGPAIIEQDLATLLVPTGFGARVGPYGDIELEKEP